MKERPILFSGAMVRAILAGRKTQTRRVITPAPIQSIMAKEGWDALRGCAGIGLLPDYANDERRIGWTWRGTRIMPWPHAIRTFSPYGTPGDRLWVRETWAQADGRYSIVPVLYRADGEDQPVLDDRWRPSIFMPRWASRITLDVASVRVERLQDITEEDAKAEGCAPHVYQEAWSVMQKDGTAFDCFVEPEPSPDYAAVVHCPPRTLSTAREVFMRLWESINGKREGAAWASNPWVFVVAFKRI